MNILRSCVDPQLVLEQHQRHSRLFDAALTIPHITQSVGTTGTVYDGHGRDQNETDRTAQANPNLIGT